MNDKIRIAIDGPGGAGKSTIAKRIAAVLSMDYIDTGAMYRAVAYKIQRDRIDLTDLAQLSQMLSDTEIDFTAGDILLDGEVINDKIRTPEISKIASDCSALSEVREKLVALQRKMGQSKSVVMDGRDIGTNVLTEAEFKIFMTAAAEERAQRRYKELIEKGQDVTFEEIISDMKARDHNDSTRALNPLRKAEDAIEIDTGGMTIEEVTEEILNIVRSNINGKSKTV